MQQHTESMPATQPGPDRRRARSVLACPGHGTGAWDSYLDKRFHHPGLLGRLRDGSRARNEAALLKHLAQAGVRVPALRAVLREGSAWVVRMELVEGARTLRERLAETPSPCSAARIARDLGHQVGLLHAARVDHVDLHAGNVLVDQADRVWLIDFSSARRRPLDADMIERDLLQGEAFLRERLPAGLRLRALAAHQRALSAPKRCGARQALPALARRLNSRGPAARRAVVARGAGRWLRNSGVVLALPSAQGELLVCRDLHPATCPPLEADAEDRLLLHDTPSNLRAYWLGAAAALEHALPGALPLSLQLHGKQPFAMFHLPHRQGVSLEDLARMLRNRGLRAEPFLTLEAPAGGLLLKPPLGLVPASIGKSTGD